MVQEMVFQKHKVVEYFYPVINSPIIGCICKIKNILQTKNNNFFKSIITLLVQTQL